MRVCCHLVSECEQSFTSGRHVTSSVNTNLKQNPQCTSYTGKETLCCCELWFLKPVEFLLYVTGSLCVAMQAVRAAVCECSTRCRSCSATSTTAARRHHATTTATGCRLRSRWHRWWTQSPDLRYETTSAAVPSVKLRHRSPSMYNDVQNPQ